MTKKQLTLGSLFDGSGGFPLGGLLCGIRPIWASEIEPFPIRVTTKRLPEMKHYGDINKLNGADLEPVDIITFGSPCQDMSHAGRRVGIQGSRSSLFFEAIRIIKEMRKATNGKYPRYIVWENVSGARSSNKGKDFQEVLRQICSIKEEDVSIPEPEKGKWLPAGNIVGDSFSVAWRLLDAQYWGVPQRRKRIYLVADFASGGGAREVLFKSEGLSRYSPESFKAWQEITRDPESGTGSPSGICLNDQGGSFIDVSNEIVSTLRAESHGHESIVLHEITDDSIVYAIDNGGDIKYAKNVSPTLKHRDYKDHPVVNQSKQHLFGNHGHGAEYFGPLDINPTITALYGTGGNNQPFVVSETNDSTQWVFENHRRDSRYSGPLDVSPTLTAILGTGGSNQPLVVNEEDETYFMTTVQTPKVSKNLAYTLLGRDHLCPPVVTGKTESKYIVRKLTPVECARLQGFPDWWCSDLGTENPTEEEIEYWKKVYKDHVQALGKTTKPKTSYQIRKWLQDPYRDSAAYKMWGNGVALPCVYFVMAGIEYVDGLSLDQLNQ